MWPTITNNLYLVITSIIVISRRSLSAQHTFLMILLVWSPISIGMAMQMVEYKLWSLAQTSMSTIADCWLVFSAGVGLIAQSVILAAPLFACVTTLGINQIQILCLTPNLLNLMPAPALTLVIEVCKTPTISRHLSVVPVISATL